MAEDLWKTLLARTAVSGAGSIVRPTTLLVCGDAQCGKSALLQRFQHRVVTAAASGADSLIEFGYFDEDEANDLSGRVGVWQLQDAAHCERFLPRLLAPASPTTTDSSAGERHVPWQRTCILICVDLSRPHDCVNSLARWLRAVERVQATIAASGALSEEQLQHMCHSSTPSRPFYSIMASKLSFLSTMTFYFF